MTVAERVLSGLGPALTEAAGPLLEDLVAGLLVGLQETEPYLELTPGGWPAVFDVYETPDPWWLGSLIGVDVTVPDSEHGGARGQIINRAHPTRGNPATIVADIQTLPQMSGTRRVDLYERDSSPGHLRIRVYDAEYSEPAPEAITDLVTRWHKPVGVTLEVEIVAGASYAHFSEEYGDYDDLADGFADYPDMYTHIPEPGTEP